MKISVLIKSQLIKDSLWSLIGNLFGKGLALLAGILVARILGKDVYGEYGIIRNTILTIGVFSTFGLGYTATKFIADFKNHKPEKIKIFIKYANQITLVFSGFMAVFLFLFADKVAIDVLKIQDLGYALRLLAILIVFNAITTTQVGMMAGFGKFKELAKINTVIGGLTFVFTVGLTYLYKFEGALMALIIVQIFNCILNYRVVKKAIPKNIHYQTTDKQLFHKTLNFSFPIALQECSYAVASWLSSVLLVRLATVGDLGMYSAAMQWNAIILFIPGILRNVVLSHLSSNVNNASQHTLILKRTIQINFIATLIPCLIIIAFSSLIAKSYGASFKGLDTLIGIAVFSTIFSSISNVYTQAYLSKNKQVLMTVLRFFRDVGILLLFLLLILKNPIEGAKKLILSNLIMNIVFMFLMIIFYKENYEKNWNSNNT